MKKLLILVVVIVVLAAGWTGASWYTGKQIEGKLNEVAASGNPFLTSLATELGIKRYQVQIQNYQRGVFSSHFQLVFQPAADQALADKTHDKQQVINATLDHGPFPLSQLAHFNLTPSAAELNLAPFAVLPLLRYTIEDRLSRVEELLKSADASGLYEDIVGIPLKASSSTRINYAGNHTVSVVKVLPIDYSIADKKIEFAGGESELQIGFANHSTNGNINDISLSGELGKLAVTATESSQAWQLSISGATLKSDYKKVKTDKYSSFQGKFSTDYHNLIYTAENNKPLLSIAKIGISGDNEFSKDLKNISMAVKYQLDNITVKDQSLGNGEIGVKLDNLDTQGLENYRNFLAHYYQTHSVTVTPSRELLIPYALGLLGDNTVVDINPVSLKNDKGDISYKLKLAFNKLDASDANTDDPAGLLINAFKSLDLHVLINKPALIKLLSQLSYAYDRTPKDASEQQQLQTKAQSEATMYTEQLSALGQQFHIIKADGDNLTSDLTYADGKVEFNGKSMTLDEFLRSMNF